MTQTAYVLGVDSLGLEYAARDAARIGAALRRHGYRIVELPARLAAIRQAMQDMAEQSKRGDTVVFYFAGHGEVEDDTLCLLLEDAGATPANSLPIGYVTTPLRQCRARHKLVILDCCRASKAAQEFKISLTEPYLVLSASGAFESSREFAELEAGFFTHQLCAALRDTPPELLNERGELRAGTLYRDWLRPRTEQHNGTPDAEQVPLPNLVYNAKHDFALVTLEPQDQALRRLLDTLPGEFELLPDGWVFPVQAALAHYRDRLPDLLYLADAMLHTHFIALASQFYRAWTEQPPAPDDALRAAFGVLGDALREPAQGADWLRRAERLSEALRSMARPLPFAELADVLGDARRRAFLEALLALHDRPLRAAADKAGLKDLLLAALQRLCGLLNAESRWHRRSIIEQMIKHTIWDYLRNSM